MKTGSQQVTNCLLDDRKSKLNSKNTTFGSENCSYCSISVPALTELHKKQMQQSLPDIVADGRICDRNRDPPGQRSVYIPPGDPCKEAYRLSTFLKFPEVAPVNPRLLAKAGFLYTGYKDRVKCFSCGSSVDSWCADDDVQAASWHRSDCLMAKGKDNTNVPLGFSLFSSSTVVRRPYPSIRSANVGPSDVPNVAIATITSAHHENLVKNLDLTKEAERLNTYDNWPREYLSVHPVDLARSGFFYLGNVDRVQCFSCGGVLRNWRRGDDVDEEHRRHFSNCRMVDGTETRNIPLPINERPVPPPARTRPVPHQEPPEPSESEMIELRNIFPCLYPMNPHMRSEQSRFETFDQRWPRGRVNATPRQIAIAGFFFFLGERDRVKCWYCNGGLQNWDPEDEPWSEHAKWFPSCEFLLRQKGPDFIRRQRALFPNRKRRFLETSDDAPTHLRSNVLRSRQARSPPPQIIDPRVEMQRQKEALDRAMNADHAKAAVEMGFSRRMVKKVIKKKITEGYEAHYSLSELIDDLASGEVSDSSDEETNAMNSETPAKAAGETAAATDRGSASNNAPTSSSAIETGDASSTAASIGAEFLPPEDIPPSIEARIRELEEERKCKICLDNCADVVFIPCGHLCSCMTCAASIRKCPICRLKIEKTIRTYTS